MNSIITDNQNEEYLKQQLEWVKYRIKMLDIIDQKLKEMRDLAEYASIAELSDVERATISDHLKAVQEEVKVLDEKSRTFWLDNQ